MKRVTAAILAAALLGDAPAAGASALDIPEVFPKVLTVELEIRSLSPVSDEVGKVFSFYVEIGELPDLIAQRALLADLADRSELLVAVFERDEGGNGIPTYHLNHTRGLEVLGGQAQFYLPSSGGGGEDDTTETILYMRLATSAGELSVYAPVTFAFPGKIESGKMEVGTYFHAETVDIRGTWHYQRVQSTHPLAVAAVWIGAD